MVSKKRGLGRGLDALLGDVNQDENSLNDSLQHFPLDMIQPGKYQPRMDMSQESLEELADSIRSQGLVQPIVVRPIDGGHYEIIAGERRWRASKLAGLESVPVLIKDVSDRNAIAMALIENIQRENLNPMEEANALHRLREEFELTHQQTAEAVGKSRATITNLLRLRNLNDDVKKLLENCDLEMGHARTLLALEGESQSEAALQIVEKGLSVRETEQLIRRLLKSSPADKQEVPQPSLEEIERLEQRLAEKLGKGFSIKHRANGKGKLVFDYSNVDELKHLIKQIGV
ncbi:MULTISPECIES: ParB/RepB/Spo0J family partition protein [unclassified Methylophaga]|jgi:ParB family chromosome partitioning protein|uniref:ParB/RepB/Spo0J family partition protein n=1 Tax=unclassified Methylophaga TaxID=2629249 RepID=UPI000C8DEE97|nr:MULTISPECIES: ParB/RepB/Spo0J family partition protein [unclassified Methylophaga]MAK66665.1 chromosome partitioning protein ParB [Methylophaga sp.]MAY17767.1 chromosome partitioning protein ParB [Methylophaga sp.]HCD05853.1 chromosome partitioning protein ParB [Methylophaga sp.]|tara:strand:+ start:5056 stop:5919 length:864 start_codon:yes stop_codon:yes gene_type:complete